MIATKTKTIEILNKYNLQAKKKFGQNFLIDSNIVKKIASLAGINKEVGVLEIGPGIGAMTEVLCMEAKKVLCYEIDNDMVNILKNELSFDNLKIINEDFLKSNLDCDFEYFLDTDEVIVVSNLPYYITTPILFKLLEYGKKIKSMYFMVQKEVCERICAQPKTKEYGSLSCLIKLQGDARKEFIVPRNVFYPAPNVDSAIVSIKLAKNDLKANLNPNFLNFIQNIFEQKRKTLSNNISNKYSIKKETIEKKLIEIGINPLVRSEELTIEQIKSIFEILF